ncbi:related to putative arabinase [Cephalotrichum gorgonifer]|uniref:Related to putative arabinase n=1 Tax=Cephalotrichum gorgonifer TaxID=2041049 RepID=A0AAE8MZ40_9PEZI|nr:related to putative arabinase [Cephalotrichum gorgonifer]
MKLYQSLLGLALLCASPASTSPIADLGSRESSELQTRQSDKGYTDYVFAHFVGEGYNGEQIYLDVSSNNNPGTGWTQANGGSPKLISNVGTRGVRDPSMIRSQYDPSIVWIIATDLCTYCNGGKYDTETGSKSIVIWESRDGMRTWSSARLAQLSPSNAGMTWAPDAIWDPEKNQYMVTWTCNLKGEGWFIMRSWTYDFKAFSPAEKFLTGAGMDVTIWRDPSSGNYYRISKNGPNELIEQAVAPSLCTNCWRVVKNQIGSGAIPKGEGPLLFPDNVYSSTWHLWIDDYSRGGGYVPFDTNNLAAGDWVRAPSWYQMPQRPRHGYVMGITAQERKNILGQ